MSTPLSSTRPVAPPPPPPPMPAPYTLHLGDSLAILPTIPDATIDAIVTDPPYELGFMGKAWDNTGIAYNVALWRQCLRVLKPGGHLIAFGGSRTYHRLAIAIEDAGFQIRDQILWLYGSGFPKSLDLSKAIDKHLGLTREVTGPSNPHNQQVGQSTTYGSMTRPPASAPASAPALAFTGWGTALKPSHEPAVLARKPLDGTVAHNVLTHRTGAINIDACRVLVPDETRAPITGKGALPCRHTEDSPRDGTAPAQPNDLGRWPANLIHDGSPAVLALFPQTDGQAGPITGDEPSAKTRNCMSDFSGRHAAEPRGDTGSAARFFYCAKADSSERHDGLTNNAPARDSDRTKPDGPGGDNPRNRTNAPRLNFHPTVKPITLMAHLIQLITPPGGTILDPFMGSGTTGVAAIRHGHHFIGIELQPDYHTIATHRITHALHSDLVSQALSTGGVS